MPRFIVLTILCLASLLLAACAELEHKLDLALYGSEEGVKAARAEMAVTQKKRAEKRLRDHEAKAFANINDLRRQHRVPDCAFDEGMQAYARLRAQELADSFDSRRPNGEAYTTLFDEVEELKDRHLTPFRELRARSLATADGVVNYWMYDIQSRKILLNNTITAFAVGVFIKDGTPYWALVTAYSYP